MLPECTLALYHAGANFVNKQFPEKHKEETK